jgi:hypothetical protein
MRSLGMSFTGPKIGINVNYLMILVNLVLAKKISFFRDLYDSMDDEEELNQNVKVLKKKIQKDFKNFKKLNRFSSLIKIDV